MTSTKPSWNTTVSNLLQRAGYDLDDESTILEIRARTELSDEEVSNVLHGNRQASVEGLYRIAHMLNVPAADLINPSNTVIQCYSIDGGKSRTISLSQEDGALAEQLTNKQLMYAEGLDESYAPIPPSALVVFVSSYEVPQIDKLYLCESGLVRCVKRCVGVDEKIHVAIMSSDANGSGATHIPIKFGKLSAVGPNTVMILGRVLCSVVAH